MSPAARWRVRLNDIHSKPVVLSYTNAESPAVRFAVVSDAPPVPQRAARRLAKTQRRQTRMQIDLVL